MDPAEKADTYVSTKIVGYDALVKFTKLFCLCT